MSNNIGVKDVVVTVSSGTGYGIASANDNNFGIEIISICIDAPVNASYTISIADESGYIVYAPPDTLTGDNTIITSFGVFGDYTVTILGTDGTYNIRFYRRV